MPSVEADSSQTTVEREWGLIMSENRYVIITDNTADLPEEFIRRNALPIVSLEYSIAGKDYDDRTEKLDPAEFYRLMRAGEMTRTNQANPDQIRDIFETYLREGYDILFVAFSSGLSGTCGNGCIAAAELREKYPERRIEVVDTLAASLGEGMLVYKALKRRVKARPSTRSARGWRKTSCICATISPWMICISCTAAAAYRRRRPSWGRCSALSPSCMWTMRAISSP